MVSNPVVDAINRHVTDPHVRLAMLVGTHLESGWRADAVGDGGWSFGAFQIYLKAHPNVTASQAKDPNWAVQYMLGNYRGGVGKVPARMWDTDPKNAAALAAFYAERPKNMYPQGRIDSAWNAVQGLGNVGSAPPGSTGTGPGGSAPGPGAGGDGTNTFGPTIPNPLDWLGDKTRAIVLTGLFVLGGIALVTIGAWQAVSARGGQSTGGTE